MEPSPRRRRLLEVLRAWERSIDAVPVRLRQVLIGLVVLVDLVAVAAITAVGSCGFAGGRCPADPTPLWEQDAVVLSFGWTAAAGALVVLLARRTGQVRAWAVAAAVAVCAGLVSAA